MYLVYKLDSSDSYLNLYKYLSEYYIKYYPVSLLKRIQILFINDNYQWAVEPYGSIIAVLISLILFSPLIIKIISEKKFRINLKMNYNVVYIIKIMVLSSLIFYFILPDDIPGQNIIYQRFTILIWIGLIVLFSRINIEKKYFNKYKLVLIASIFIFYIYVFEYFFAFQYVCKDFNSEIFKGIKRDEKVFGLFFESNFRGRPIFIHFHNYFTVWNKGISGGVVDYRFSLIKRKTDLINLPTHNPWAGNLEKYNNEYNNVDYILSREENPRYLEGFELYKKQGSWLLYKNIKLNNK